MYILTNKHYITYNVVFFNLHSISSYAHFFTFHKIQNKVSHKELLLVRHLNLHKL